MVKLANTLVLGASASACGFDSHYPHHVGASFASLAPIFLQKSERAQTDAPPFRKKLAATAWSLDALLRLFA